MRPNNLTTAELLSLVDMADAMQAELAARLEHCIYVIEEIRNRLHRLGQNYVRTPENDRETLIGGEIAIKAWRHTITGAISHWPAEQDPNSVHPVERDCR